MNNQKINKSVGRPKLSYTKEELIEKVYLYNQFRVKQSFFIDDDFRHLFKKMNFPLNNVILKSLKDRGFIISTGNRTYEFTEKPLSYAELNWILQDYQQNNKRNHDRIRAEKTSHKASIEAAIALLKSEGYVIYKQV